MRPKLLWSALALLLILSFLPALAPDWWFADLCSHFRVQAGAAGAAAALAFALSRQTAATLAAAAIIVINVTALWPAAGQAQVAAGRPRALRVAFANVYYRNPHTDRVARFALESGADVVVLAEITPAWNAALADLERHFPYRHYAYLEGQRRAGTLLLSRLPLESATTLSFGRGGDPGVSAEVRVGTKLVHLIGVHPTWPLWRAATQRRNAQYARIAALARAAGGDTIVVGDFNATPFSPAYARFVAASGLMDASNGRGWMPTWPTFFPPFGLEIDHALVSRDLYVVQFERGPRVGSDHLPIVLDLATPL